MKIRARLSTELARRAIAETRNARARWASRESVLVALRDDEGLVGLGEGAPLPGFSPDTLGDVRAALAPLALAPIEIDPRPRAITDEVERVLGRLSPGLPSARFAVETALLDLVGRRLGQPVWRLLEDEPRGAADSPTAVPLAALVTRIGGEGLDEARRAVARGVRTLKIKIGRQGDGVRERELAFVARVRDAVGDGVALRVDANQMLGVREVDGVLRALARAGVSFVEEPVAFDELGHTLRRLGAHTPVPIALDESLARPDLDAWLDELLDHPALRVIVLKPTLVGGSVRARALAARARRRGVSAVVSHCFEGPIGWTACASLALSLPDRLHAAGLDPTSDLLPDLPSAFVTAPPRAISPSEVSGLGVTPWRALGRPG